MTPLKAVRKHCFSCVGQSQKEVRECNNPPGSKYECVLHPYRFGKNPENYESFKLKIIHKYCQWCMNSIYVADCLADGIQSEPRCNLYDYRFGKNPKLKGKRVSPFSRK